VKANLIIALVVGAFLGFVVGRVTKSAPAASAAQALPQAPSAAKAQPRPSEDPNAVYKIPVDNSPSTGSASAKVTIVEATDFQSCKKAYCVYLK
jgi:protein-disulfide isomerase